MIERTGFPSLPCDLPDDLLTVRAADGDEDSFAVLVHRHSRPLLATACCMLGSVQDAEDAVQDAFVSAWRRLPEYHHHAQFRTWMYRITVNRCLTMLSRRPPDLPLDAVPEPATSDMWSSPVRSAEQEAATTALLRALTELDPGQRVCWILRELQGLPYKEIADITHVSEPTVRGRLFRARRALQEAMAPWR
ncbi:RNA polymerase sigma factor [Streptomyces mexicanus]|uniref:RNA polymerase sigma factor n=1 Tax=Streptomyces mexicanus TaxID=178566 RepID=UPI0036AD64F9